MSQLKKYKRIKYLGKGSYGAAILVELRSDPSKKFVIKEIVIGHLKPAEQASAKSEADVLHQMNHSNITMYVESFVESSKLYIVMEHADGGDLSGAIQKRKAESNYYAEDEVMRIFVQICLALKHVHGANILHRDLKSQNIFLTLNGMVKLGDFGIAKVLDASDDQARTQIGTPYYLSPEICESQPYGRKSDVWSLGVVLYEIIALEMPFQAQSLPALVARICNSEPNYKLVETKYSPNLIALTKSMLSKSPDKRPSLNQIVKTDFIMSHISKLLSYTLKMGNGGVVDALLKPSDLGNLSVEDADRNIEQARQRQREQERQKAAESKDAQVNSEREAKRLEEREKLRRFRQDMKNKQRENLDGASVGEDSKDSRSNRGRSPTRGASPLRGQSPRRGVAGDVSPARGRSPVNNRNGGVASPRRGNSPVRQQVNYDSPVGPSGRKQYNNAPNPVVDTSNQPRMYRQEGRRDENSNRAVGPPPKSEQQPITYAPPQQQQQSRNSGAGKSLAELQAERQRQMDQMRRGSNESAYRDVRNSHGGDERSVVRSSRPSDPYEDAAAREFWANRQAAQAHKARIESDLHGGERLSIISGQPVGSKGPSGHVRRPSEHDRDQQLVGHNGAAESRRYNLYDDEKNEAENRILAIKAQKEKDRERELALKEMQLKQAIEENRDLERRRRDAQNFKGAVAFDIDLSGGDSVMTKVTPPPLSNHRLAGLRRSESKESSPMAEQATRNKQSVQSVQKQQQPQPSNAVNKSVEQQRQQVIADETMCSYDSVLGDNIAPVNSSAAPSSNISSTNTSAKQKKGWGPKVDPSEVQIAKGVARYDGVKAPSAMFDKDTALTPHSAGSRKSVGATDNDDSGSALSQLDEPGGNEAGNDSEVRKFLAKKRESQLEARNQAKGVLSRLREQRKSEAEGKKQRVVRSSVGADSKGGVVSPKKPRMMDVLSSVEMAQDAVQRAVAGNMKFLGRIQGADSKAEAEVNLVLSPQNVDSAADSKTPTKQQGSPEKACGSKDEAKAPQQSKDAGEEDNGDELNEMLQHWLQDQKRGVTTRRKAQHHHFESEDDQAALSGLVSSDTEVEEEDGLVGHVTASARGLKEGIRRGVSPSDIDGDSAGNGLSEGAGRGVYMGNDVEVVGMQCMLAKMLMGERGRDSDDDTDDEA